MACSPFPAPAEELGRRSAYDPETLALLHRAYAEAWEEMTGSMPEGGGDQASLRMTLATRVMALASTGERDIEKLKRSALRACPASG